MLVRVLGSGVQRSPARSLFEFFGPRRLSWLVLSNEGSVEALEIRFF